MEGNDHHRHDHDHPRHENGKQAVRGSQNIAQLLRCRREGRVPSSAGAGVLGGQTSARSSSAEMRGSGMSNTKVAMRRCGTVNAGVGRSPFGFRRSMMDHPSMINRLGHAATMRGHTRELDARLDRSDGTRSRDIHAGRSIDELLC